MLGYYVYVYIDPRPSNLNEPFYIGKGKGDRAYIHLRESGETANSRKNQKIKDILDAGYKPIVKFLYENLTEHEAYTLEREAIISLGREGIDPAGVLTNLICNLPPRNFKGQSIDITHPNIAAQIDPSNSVRPDQITFGSRIKLTFNCNDCGLKYPTALYSRTAKHHSSGCPACYECKRSQIVRIGRTKNQPKLDETHPHLISEWHPENHYKPYERVSQSHERPMWICRDCGYGGPNNCDHKWIVSIQNRTKHKSGCPSCAKKNASKNLRGIIKSDDHKKNISLSKKAKFLEKLKANLVIPSVKWSEQKQKWRARLQDKTIGHYKTEANGLEAWHQFRLKVLMPPPASPPSRSR